MSSGQRPVQAGDIYEWPPDGEIYIVVEPHPQWGKDAWKLFSLDDPSRKSWDFGSHLRLRYKKIA